LTIIVVKLVVKFYAVAKISQIYCRGRMPTKHADHNCGPVGKMRTYLPIQWSAGPHFTHAPP